MQGTRMVPLSCVPSEFAGRVLVAKLGSVGILAELRGVSRIYPTVLGAPVVYVEATELAEARELITVDTEDGLAADPADAVRLVPPSRRHLLRPLLVVVALVLLASLSFGARSCDPAAGPSSVRLP